jgi:phosphoglycerol transferase MdoB-like AlkP superfamily enzyme
MQGYETAAFLNTAFLLPSKGYRRGWDHFQHVFPEIDDAWDVVRNHSFCNPHDGALVNQALPFVRETTAPWFAYVHMFGPHAPYDEPQRIYDFGEETIDLYDAKLRYADEELGRLLAAVPRNTIVIITADHGEEFGEHGGTQHGKTLYDEVLRVPLLIRWPGQEPRVETGLVGLDRMAPALLEGKLPETGGEVRCDLEKRYPDGRIKKRLKRIITEADIDPDHTPAVDADALRREQLEALGYS